MGMRKGGKVEFRFFLIRRASTRPHSSSSTTATPVVTVGSRTTPASTKAVAADDIKDDIEDCYNNSYDR